jgi:hypothetical protein
MPNNLKSVYSMYKMYHVWVMQMDRQKYLAHHAFTLCTLCKECMKTADAQKEKGWDITSLYCKVKCHSLLHVVAVHFMSTNLWKARNVLTFSVLVLKDKMYGKAAIKFLPKIWLKCFKWSVQVWNIPISCFVWQFSSPLTQRVSMMKSHTAGIL